MSKGNASRHAIIAVCILSAVVLVYGCGKTAEDESAQGANRAVPKIIMKHLTGPILSEGVKTGMVDIAWPYLTLDSRPVQVEKINASIESKMKNVLVNTAEKADDVGGNISAAVRMVTNERGVFSACLFGIDLGASYGTGQSAWLNYDIDTGNEITLDALLNMNAQCLTTISSICSPPVLTRWTSLLGTQNGESNLGDTREKVKELTSPRPQNFTKFTVLPAGINFYFDCYPEPVTVFVPLDKLKPYLAVTPLTKRLFG
jgi:hypothetical protein